MVLDDGICTVFRKVDVAKPGNMPKYDHQVIGKYWYGELSFESSPARPTEGREEVQTDARIRILQNRQITNNDVVVMANVNKVEDVLKVYEVTRAYHGKDDDSGERITDLTLRRVRP